MKYTVLRALMKPLLGVWQVGKCICTWRTIVLAPCPDLGHILSDLAQSLQVGLGEVCLVWPLERL